jgi:SDR family mycofactocin-dependent oxidoreductase
VTRVALVTGAARGIGAATVQRLAGLGWAVLAVDRCEDDPALPYGLGTRVELEAVVADARSAAGDPQLVESLVVDARDATGLEDAISIAEAKWGGLDAAIAVAGVIAGGLPMWEVPLEQERAVLEVNLGAALTLARVAVPALLRRPAPRSGRFVAVASTAANKGLPMLAAYCAAKAGVAGLVRALAAELRGSGVTANAVSPGSTATRMLDETARLYGLSSTDSFATQQAIGRLLRPDEIAAALVWLAGAESSGMTGAIVAIDGGFDL